jgi:hypothetical protein
MLDACMLPKDLLDAAWNSSDASVGLLQPLLISPGFSNIWLRMPFAFPWNNEEWQRKNHIGCFSEVVPVL